MHRITFPICIALAFATFAFAGDDRLGQVKSSVHSGPYFPAPQFFYFVGQPVRIEALVEAEKRRDGEYREFLEFKKFRAKFEAYRNRGAAKPAGERDHPVDPNASVAVLASRCSSCHGGAAPEGGFFLDGRHALTASQITAAQRRVLRGEMPPTGKLPDEEINSVLRELLALEASP
jgi:mono/diheme cytochrome c family protein